MKNAKKTIKISLADRICAYIEKNSPCTLEQVLGEFGRLISAASARRAYERCMKHTKSVLRRPIKVPPTQQGRRRCLTLIVRRLWKTGRIRRMKPGIYAALTNKKLSTA